jgi:hypothetical protein
VQPGDVLGLNQASGLDGTACIFAVPGEPPSLVRLGNLADGDSGDFVPSSSDLRNNVSAVFVPTNTFSLGATTRDKKKGTATITATVPNPGELTASGNGVKAAAAVISKVIPAPGTAQLLIKAKGKKKRKLNETGKVKLRVDVTYTPTGGDPSTQSKKLRLQKR